MQRTGSAIAIVLWLLLGSELAHAQTIGLDELDVSSGGISVAFAGLTPHSSLNIYSAASLRARGICGGAALLDLAILPAASPGQASTGTYAAPQALLQLGHVVAAPQAGGWSANLIAPITVHGLSSGPFTFPWTANTFAPLPGLAGTGFVWDGVHDIGLLFAAPSGPTGTFLARTSSERVQAAFAFPPTTAFSAPANSALKVRLTFAPGPPCATRTSHGTGCYAGAVSFYESFLSLAAFDLAGSATSTIALRATPTGSGFSVASAPSAWQTLASAPLLANGSPFPMIGESFSAPLVLPFSFPFPGGSTSVIHASMNGFVLLGATAAATSDSTPTTAEILVGPARLYPLWADLDVGVLQPNSGVFFDVDPTGQAAYVTWLCRDGRAGLGPPPPSSVRMQCVLRSSGEFEFRYQHLILNPTATGGALVGWSPGSTLAGNAVNPGPVDLSQAMPFSTTGPESLPLHLEADPPALGAPWRLSAQPITGLVPTALLFFGTGSLPGPDLGVIGAPGCRAYSTADITSVTMPAASGFATATATIPRNPQLIGVAFTAQAAAFTFRNPLGLVTSNGMQFVVGR